MSFNLNFSSIKKKTKIIQNLIFIMLLLKKLTEMTIVNHYV
jgi:hypothetical protein